MGYSFYNGYPVILSDSGTYINSGFELTVSWDRPIAYSLFIVLSSFKISLWLTIFFQCLITAFIIDEFLKLVLSFNYKHFHTPLIIFILVFITGLSTPPLSGLLTDSFQNSVA